LGHILTETLCLDGQLTTQAPLLGLDQQSSAIQSCHASPVSRGHGVLCLPGKLFLAVSVFLLHGSYSPLRSIDWRQDAKAGILCINRLIVSTGFGVKGLDQSAIGSDHTAPAKTPGPKAMSTLVGGGAVH
jgi:hypothetical protein